ncbi:MAG: ROK family protein [Rhodospirillales bacterium]|nr:ROK family protein [Rhodospirillales bacterium]
MGIAEECVHGKGGPSAFITLSDNRFVGAIEVSNNRIHVGIGSISGELRYAERVTLEDGASSAAVAAAFDHAVEVLKHGMERLGGPLEQIAVTLPGFDATKSHNPIFDISPETLRKRLTAAFCEIPVQLENSIVARAVAQQLRQPSDYDRRRYLYVYIGHGVAAAMVDRARNAQQVLPCEIGHIVLDPNGPLCRCGHHGCMEAYASTTAIAPSLKIEEAELLSLGDAWPEKVPISAKASVDLDDRLFKIGMAIGNTLNALPARQVLVGGWPVGLTEKARQAIEAGIDSCMFGGGDNVGLEFVQSELGREPGSALAFATFVYLGRGAMAPDGRAPRTRAARKAEIGHQATLLGS